MVSGQQRVTFMLLNSKILLVQNMGLLEDVSLGCGDGAVSKHEDWSLDL